MPATAAIELRYTDRAAVNHANSEHSTGPRTDAGKQRSSLNALRHGLTARSAVLPSEDPASFERHCRQFLDEYQPATATETHLVQELADISWRLKRIPLLEADLFAADPNPQSPVPQPPATSHQPPVTSHQPPVITGNPPTMASFFQKTKWNAPHNA